MKRLFVFLLSLRHTKFWGDVTIKFKDGAFTGQVLLNQSVKEDAMPAITAEAEVELHKVFMDASQ